MNEIVKIIFGEFTLLELFGYLWFFIIGYLIYGLTEASGRDVKSKKTPRKWNWKFWFYDNWRRYITTVLCTYILFRFYTEISGHPFGYFDAVSLGLIGDGIAATIKKRITSNDRHRRRLMNENDEFNEDDGDGGRWDDNDGGRHDDGGRRDDNNDGGRHDDGGRRNNENNIDEDNPKAQ